MFLVVNFGVWYFFLVFKVQGNLHYLVNPSVTRLVHFLTVKAASSYFIIVTLYLSTWDTLYNVSFCRWEILSSLIVSIIVRLMMRGVFVNTRMNLISSVSIACSFNGNFPLHLSLLVHGVFAVLLNQK